LKIKLAKVKESVHLGTFTVSFKLSVNKKVQQSWQTSALAKHLPLACLVSMSAIFYLLPNSSIVILLFSISVNSMC